MGYGLIAAAQSRDSPVEEYLYSSRRGLLSSEDRQSLAMPTDWSPLGGIEAGEPLRGGIYSGSQTLFLSIIFSIYFTNATQGSTVLNRMRLRHDVCMLNWLLLGDGDI